MSRKSPEARLIATERRIADRYGRKSENRHARRVKTFERNAAAMSYRAGVNVA